MNIRVLGRIGHLNASGGQLNLWQVQHTAQFREKYLCNFTIDFLVKKWYNGRGCLKTAQHGPKGAAL